MDAWRLRVWDGLPKCVIVVLLDACVCVCVGFPSSAGLVKSRVNLPGPPGKPKYYLVTDSG